MIRNMRVLYILDPRPKSGVPETMLSRILMFILYYTIPYCTILYYTILYYTILYYTILYYTILYYTILYYTILYYTILYYTIPYYTILYSTIRYDTILYHTSPYCTIRILMSMRFFWGPGHCACGSTSLRRDSTGFRRVQPYNIVDSKDLEHG